VVHRETAGGVLPVLSAVAALPAIGELNLNGTRVTDAGVREIEKASPRTNVTP
jgi:hypothetical protein